MKIRSFLPYFIIIGLTSLAALALAYTVDVTLSDKSGIQMELPSSLPGGWKGDELRFSHNAINPKEYSVSELEFPNIDPETGEKLYKMSKVEYDALPRDTQFVKSIYTNDSSEVFVSIVLSGAERNSIHRPERCLPGQGTSIVGKKNIKIPLDGRSSLKVHVLETARSYEDSEGNPKTFYGYDAYWFVGQNRETSSHYVRMFWLAWDRVFHSVAHKWAYISISGTRDKNNPKDYEEEIKSFVQKLYPGLLLEDHKGC